MPFARLTLLPYTARGIYCINVFGLVIVSYIITRGIRQTDMAVVHVTLLYIKSI